MKYVVVLNSQFATARFSLVVERRPRTGEDPGSIPGAWSKFVFEMLFVSHCNHRGRNADLVTTRTLPIALHKASKDPKINYLL